MRATLSYLPRQVNCEMAGRRDPQDEVFDPTALQQLSVVFQWLARPATLRVLQILVSPREAPTSFRIQRHLEYCGLDETHSGLFPRGNDK